MTVYVFEISSFFAGVALGAALVFVLVVQRRRDNLLRESFSSSLAQRSRVEIPPRVLVRNNSHLVPPPPPTKEAHT